MATTRDLSGNGAQTPDSFEPDSQNALIISRRFAAITPSDTVDLSRVTRGIYVGVSGDVAIIGEKDNAAVTFKNAAAGSILPVRAKRVMSTNTTATNLVSLF